MDLINVQTFPQVVAYLRDEMDWPIERADFQEEDELFFSYKPHEFGIDDRNAAKIESIRRLRPLSVGQPWGVFFVKFEPKRLPVGALRRILSGVTEKKRASANPDDRAVWSPNDLLFASNYGEGDDRKINFAHFASNEENNDLPTLKVIEWDSKDSLRHREHVAQQLTTKLSWPENTQDKSKWREQWASAFTLKHREVITTSKELAVELAKLAQEIRKKINDVLEIETEDGPVSQMMATVKKALVHDLDKDGFADMYAQTIAYGLLSARITNPTDVIADDLVAAMPVTNPFLKELMETFMKVGGRKGTAATGGLDFDELGVSEVVELLRKANMEAVLRDFGDRNQQEDPVIHFFEGFLQEYDKSIRKGRGVFYTPRPVVSFIVRSVDELLRNDFGLEDGLADTTTWGEMSERIDDLKIPEGATAEQDFVQILDPATGTGTFLVEVIDLVHKTMTEKWRSEGRGAREIEKLWNDYVPTHLLPRLHGYELMMAPYAIAHMKIGLKLFETGYRFESDERARVYLTNALEPAQDFSDTLAFAIPALAHEAEAVNEIKRDQRFTVVIGNPPYSYVSQNTGDWITGLIREYYVVNEKPLGERNPKGLLDDYVKFIRFSQNALSTSGLGILGFITSNGYLDNPTFRGMRQSLINTFNRVFITDLHGSVKKQEGDQNVFQIQQGVAVGIFSKSPDNLAMGLKVGRVDKLGTRLEKYDWLASQSPSEVRWDEILPQTPEYVLAFRDQELLEEYSEFLNVKDIFNINISGFKTHRDHFAVAMDRATMEGRVGAMLSVKENDSELRERFSLGNNWNLTRAREDLRAEKNPDDFLCRSLYRPFDYRYCFLHKGMMDRPRPEFRKTALGKNNLFLTVGRQGQAVNDDTWSLAFCSRVPVDVNLYRRGSVEAFPVSIFDGRHTDDLFARTESRGSGFHRAILEASRGAFTTEHACMEGDETDADPHSLGLFYFVYSVLFSLNYRRRYDDFLETAFPRIPLPKGSYLIKELVALGRELVTLHLMESPCLHDHITTPVGSGDLQVEKISYSDQVVWIDKAKTSGFRGVPEEVWNFHIGGYQVCEKWLKDRQAKGGKNPRPGRILSDDDITHYQKIVVALSETIRIMGEIDEVIEEHGGWPGAFQTD